MNYFQYWAKTAPDGQYHLLPYHSLDVAACGRALLEVNPRLVARVGEAIQLGHDETKSLLVYLLSLHDFGKFSRTFQTLCKEVALQLRPEVRHKPYSIKHDTLGMGWWMEKASFPEEFDQRQDVEWIANAIFGHHGVPPEGLNEGDAVSKFDPHNQEAASTLEGTFRELFKPVWPLEIQQEEIRGVSWLIAGWAVLADWLGSNDQVFVYQQEHHDLQEYYEAVLVKARTFVAESGLVPPVVAKCGFDSLFPGYRPTALQKWADEVTVPSEPTLFILEDATGSGKTEAALTLASRIMFERGFTGLFIGLPTMATSNQMFDRTLSMYRALYGQESRPSIVLAHGQRKLSDRFRDGVAIDTVSSHTRSYDAEGKDVTAGGFCSEWISDRAKKSLLADVGVGTVDQLLLGMLPSRHQSLRMYGIVGKVIIIDEVHAYDEYMNKILETLLSFAYREGLYVVLLSATLTQEQKSRFVACYQGGEIWSQDFPLATSASSGTAFEAPIEGDPTRVRTYGVQRIGDEEEALTLVQQYASQGRCVCWIRNTVDDAIRAFNSLRVAGQQVELFHARFAAADRQKIEGNVLSRFGKDSRSEVRRGRILIATQVVEQSLDLDFDEMVSDLAPVDLLIQRVGRMRRHIRDSEGNFLGPGNRDERGEARLHILSPDPTVVEHGDWFSVMFPGGAAVYPDVEVIWRTANALFEHEQIELPTQSRELVEEVYYNPMVSEFDSPTEVPEVLSHRTDQAMAKKMTKSNMGRMNSLKLDSGYASFGMDNWRPEIKTPTRWSDRLTFRVRLAIKSGSRYLPLCTHPQFPWEMSEVGVSQSLFGDPVDSVEETAALETMPDQGRWAKVLVLRDDHGVLKAERLSGQKQFTLTYSPETGLTKMEET